MIRLNYKGSTRFQFGGLKLYVGYYS